MDWFLDPPTATTATRLRRDITEFLRRHAPDERRIWAAATIVGELLGNAVDHAGGPIWVTLDWEGERPVLTVHDLGPTFEFVPSLPDLTAERGRGLWIVSQLAIEVTIEEKRGGGKRVRAVLPVRRQVERSAQQTERSAQQTERSAQQTERSAQQTERSLAQQPRPVEPVPPGPDGGPAGLSRDALLRTLLAHLVLAVEDISGPHEAQTIFSRLGASVGGQVELEYRAATGVAAELTTAQLAECYTRLKRAIGGDFFVVGLSEDMVVLGNTRCPFGKVICTQPALCRLTSSVFGGIAARNAGRAVVMLEERIAVGDPECRVTVLLGARADLASTGHRY